MEEERKWENLASDCLVCIFCHVGLEELTVALPFVCKSWYEASSDPRCWKKLVFQEEHVSNGSKFERRFTQGYCFKSSFAFYSFMKLCIDRSRGSAIELAIESPDFASILQGLIYASIGCPRLKVLAFSGVLRQDEKQLPEFISKWKELEILKISDNPCSILEILEQISINCPNFIGLHLREIFGTEQIRAIVGCFPRLKILVIRGSIIHKEHLMEILEGCRELEALDVSDCAGFDVDNEILLKASMIKKFECKNTTKNGTILHRLMVNRLRVAEKYGHMQQPR